MEQTHGRFALFILIQAATGLILTAGHLPIASNGIENEPHEHSHEPESEDAAKQDDAKRGERKYALPDSVHQGGDSLGSSIGSSSG